MGCFDGRFRVANGESAGCGLQGEGIMKTAFLPLCATVVAVGLGGPALAQGTGADGYFEIHIDTDDNVVIGFYTNDGDGWSSNWLDEDVGPGESAVAEFIADSGPCEQVLRVGWLANDGGEVVDDPISIDICDASNVYLGDNDITYD